MFQRIQCLQLIHNWTYKTLKSHEYLQFQGRFTNKQNLKVKNKNKKARFSSMCTHLKMHRKLISQARGEPSVLSS